MNRIDVVIVTTAEQREHAYDIRRRVFRDEQRIPEEEEFDADDDTATHALAVVDGCAVGTGRLILHADHAKIGRMAVLSEARRHGVGSALLRRLMEVAAARGAVKLLLHAQVQAIPFYAAAGFEITSGVFDEAGIPHRRMERRVDR